MKTKFPLSEVLQSVDSKDADAFSTYLTDDAVFRYGSQAPVKGRQAVRDYVAGFFGTVEALEHRVLDTWENDASLVCRGEATYTRHDGLRVTVPFVNVLHLDRERIRDYLVYVDPSPLLQNR